MCVLFVCIENEIEYHKRNESRTLYTASSAFCVVSCISTVAYPTVRAPWWLVRGHVRAERGVSIYHG